MNSLEQRAKAYNRILLKRGLAKIDKIPTNMEVARWIGEGKALCFAGNQSLLDFVGLLLDGSARYLTFDCKMTADASWHKGLYKKHQIGLLKAAHEFGALSFTLVESKRTERVYALSSGLLDNMPVKWGDLEPFALNGCEWFPLIGVFL